MTTSVVSVSQIMRIEVHNRSMGVTLMELLCVVAIIGILLALYLPSIARAFKHARHVVLGE